MRPFLLLALPLVLAGCGDSAADKTATVPDVAINAKGNDGEAVAITADAKSGNVSIDAGEFQMKMKVPDWVDVSGGDFDIDGAKLYPGSTVTSIKVDADETKAKGKRADVRIAFTSPAAPAAVADWMVKELGDNGVTATRTGTTLAGKTKDGNPFTVALDADGAASKGLVQIRN